MTDIKLSLPDISESEIEIVSDVLRSGWLAHGKYNDEFERKFADYIGVKHAVSLNSCTSALELALWAANIPKGREVIIPSFTWVSTCNVVILQGLKPVFCDIEVNTFNIDVSKIEKLITPNTAAIIGVHFAGLPCDNIAIEELCNLNNILFIEDSAEAIGSSQKSIKTGSTGVGCFSFYPTKNMTTCEGGMLTFNDQLSIEKVRALAAHGIIKSSFERSRQTQSWRREAEFTGRNFRMPNPLAALGVTQLQRLNAMNAKREILANRYKQNLRSNNFIKFQQINSGFTHSYQMLCAIIPDTDKSVLIQRLNSKGIGISSHFDPPLHQQKAYKDHHNKELPITEFISKNIYSFPMHTKMELNDVDVVCNLLLEALA